jgi:hypothetical protein
MRERFFFIAWTVVIATAMSCVAWAQANRQPPVIAPTAAPNPTTVVEEADSEQVIQCAEFRDSLLLSSGWGIWLSDFYYRFSPYALAATTHSAREGNSQLRWLVNVGIRCLLFTFRHPIIIWTYLLFLLFPLLAACGKIGLRAPKAVVLPKALETLRIRRWTVAIVWCLLCLASGVFFLPLRSGLTGGDNGNSGGASRPDKLSTASVLSPGIVREYAKARSMTMEDLTACLRHPSGGVRYEAAYIAAKSPNHTYESELIRALADPDLRVRRWAATGLATLCSKAAFDELVKLLKDPHAMVRYKAAYALGKACDRRAVAVLKEKLADENEYLCVRIFAFQALERILSGPSQH